MHLFCNQCNNLIIYNNVKNQYFWKLFFIVLRKFTQKQIISWHTDLYQLIENQILKHFAKFHRNPMKHLEVMSKNVNFWPFLATNPPNPGLRIFMRKTKTSLFLFYCYTTLCQKSERSNAWFSRKSVMDGRTNRRRRINRSHFCLRQGTKNVAHAASLELTHSNAN